MKKIILILTVVLFSCTKEEVTPRAYPRVLTNGIANKTKTSADLNGEITVASVAIIDHGFFVSLTNYIGNAEKFSLGEKSSIGTFNTSIDSFSPGTTYYVRAYAQSNDNIVYGNLIQFTTLK